MKTLYLLLLGIVCSFALQAQKANKTKESFQKLGNVDAVTITLDAVNKNVESVLADEFRSATSLKAKSSKGWKALIGVVFPSISNKKMDIYYRVEKAGSKESPRARVSLVMSLGNETFLESQKYPEEVQNAVEYLETLPRKVRMYELELAIEDLYKQFDKTEKEYDKMGVDSVKLETLLLETQQSIEDNKLQRESQRAKIADEEARIAEFKQLLEDVRNNKKTGEMGVDVKKTEDEGEDKN